MLSLASIATIWTAGKHQNIQLKMTVIVSCLLIPLVTAITLIFYQPKPGTTQENITIQEQNKIIR